MKEVIALILIVLIYSFLSYLLHKLFMKIHKWYFVLLIFAGYVLFTLYYLEGLNTFHHYLRDNHIYFEFGHANELLVATALVCLFIAAINIVWIVVKKMDFKKYK